MQLAVLLATMGFPGCPTDLNDYVTLFANPTNVQVVRGNSVDVTVVVEYYPPESTADVTLSLDGEVPVGIAFVASSTPQTGCGVAGMTLDGTGETSCVFRLQVGPQAQLGVFQMHLTASTANKHDDIPFTLTILSG